MSVFPRGIYADPYDPEPTKRHHGRHTTVTSIVVCTRQVTEAGFVEIQNIV